MGQAVHSVPEIRTRRAPKQPVKAKELTPEQQERLNQLRQKLNAEWFKLKRSRHEVGGILREIRDLLKQDGAFADFLMENGIPRSTAYDLIQDHERWSKLPEPLRESAERNNVDLAEKKYSEVLDQICELVEVDGLSQDKADELVQVIVGNVKRNKREPFRLESLSRDQRPLKRAFQAMNSAIVGDTQAESAARLSRLIGYLLHTQGIKPKDLRLEPEQPPLWIFTGVGEGEGK